MAATAISLQFRRSRTNTLIGNPSSLNFFFSSSSSSSIPEPPNNVQDETTPSKPKSSFSSYFSDVKSSLRQGQQQQQQRSPSFQPPPPNHSPRFSKPTPTLNPSKIATFDEIRKNLSEFRSRTTVPPPSGTASHSSSPSSLPRASPTVSFQELYKKSVMAKGDVQDTGEATKKMSYDMIRESLKQLRPTTPVDANNRNDLPNRSKLTSSLLGGPRSTTPVFGGTDSLPHKVFGKESNKKAGAESAEMKRRFVRPYNYGELGEKLRMLRPEEANKKTDKWFSLKELSERLTKLREIDENEPVSNSTFTDLRESLFKLSSQDEAAKTKKSSFHRIDVLGQLGGTPDYMLSPPKEHLLEKYFHPDNMSSAEKMKIELKKVRDEFKMSESDCGSARVQVAQLTTKIKHLSTTLHKKDKHSRKGLQAMVQQRKKLLKYLRRTDWDSYCLVLDKLGLRDNPDYKN